MKKQKIVFISVFFISVLIISCALMTGGVVIDEPDEYSKTYEAKEEIVLRAIARVFKERQIGRNVIINMDEQSVKTDYVTQEDWRTKGWAKARKLNWKETEAIVSIITEKKTKAGWQMMRMLKKEQYTNLFSEIEMRIYEEMAKIQ